MARPEEALPGATSAATELGAELRRLRHARGLTQTAVADRLGCSPATIGQVERGRFKPSADLLEDWEIVLDARGQLTKAWQLAVIDSHSRRSRNCGNRQSPS